MYEAASIEPTVSRYMSPVPVTVGADTPLASAHRLMREYQIRHLPVMRRNALVGVLSERDVYFIERFDTEELTVAEAMSPSPYAVAPDARLREVAARMAAERLGSAVVMEGRRIVGIFTVTDALRALADQLPADAGRSAP